MYKITFQDQTTASLIKLQDKFALVTPELSIEAHAALCLFLPNENLADNEPKNLPKPTKPKLPPGTLVLVPLDSGWSRASVLEDRDDGYTRVDTCKEELIFTREALIEVHSQDKRRIDLENVKEGGLLRVVTGCKGLKLGEVVTFRGWVPDVGHMKIDTEESVKLFNARHFQLN